MERAVQDRDIPGVVLLAKDKTGMPAVETKLALAGTDMSNSVLTRDQAV